MVISATISSRTFKRVGVDALLLLGAFLLPWWLVLFSACVMVFVFGNFFELLLVAFLIDLLYGSPLPYFFNSSFILSIGAAVSYVVLSVIKTHIRF